MMLKDEYRKPDTKAWQLMANSYNGGAYPPIPTEVYIFCSFFLGSLPAAYGTIFCRNYLLFVLSRC